MVDDTCPTCGPICGMSTFTPSDILDYPTVVGPPETWDDTDADH